MKYEQLQELYNLPFFDLLEKAHNVHKEYWPDNEVQLCTLLSIKTGGCSEDCSYCAQSSRYDTGVKAEKLLPKELVLERAMVAKASGSTRFCMGAAWKGVQAGSAKFQEVIEIVKAVSSLGLEVCATLGQLGVKEAKELKEAGLTAYNHNIDTSPEYYPNIVTSHTFEDRLGTIRAVQEAGISVCCGGILGLGEQETDRLRMLEVISEFNPAPESVPINALMPMQGTPLEENDDKIDSFEMIRLIAVARIALPTSKVRLSAGRSNMSQEGQALCFYAGANSIFYGDKLLTASNPSTERDKALLTRLNLAPKSPDPSLMAPLPNPDMPLYPDEEPHGCMDAGPCHESLSH